MLPPLKALGRIALAMGRDRIDKLMRLLENEPDDSFCLYGLGQEYAREGNHEKALAYYDRLLEVDPDYVYGYYHKARSLEALQRVDEARQTLKDGLERAMETGDDKAAGEINELLGSMPG